MVASAVSSSYLTDLFCHHKFMKRRMLMSKAVTKAGAEGALLGYGRVSREGQDLTGLSCIACWRLRQVIEAPHGNTNKG